MYVYHAYVTVAHKGKTQLTILDETQQPIPKHNGQFQNTTIISETQRSIVKHNTQF